jgi:hypothetical protein
MGSVVELQKLAIVVLWCPHMDWQPRRLVERQQPLLPQHCHSGGTPSALRRALSALYTLCKLFYLIRAASLVGCGLHHHQLVVTNVSISPLQAIAPACMKKKKRGYRVCSSSYAATDTS